jgi:hypothetical protein
VNTEHPIAGWSPADNLGAVALSEAGAWRLAADLCAARIREGKHEQTDARLFLMALRQFRNAARLASVAVRGTGEAAALERARQAFAEAVPDAKDAGDMVEHFIEYAQGTGRRQRTGVPRAQQAAKDWPFHYNPASDEITLGTCQVDVAGACEQARRLEFAIWTAVRDT